MQPGMPAMLGCLPHACFQTFLQERGRGKYSAQRRHLPRAGDLDGALHARAPLGQVAPLPALVHEREAVECAHHAPVARIDHPLRRVALACAVQRSMCSARQCMQCKSAHAALQVLLVDSPCATLRS
jgi:hypothetical protein